MHKNFRYSYFYNGRLDSNFRFSVKQPNIRKNRVKISTWVTFRIMRDKKVKREKRHLLKLEFYNANRKMKGIISCVFISIIMHPNFMHFRQKMSFKIALQIFNSVCVHLRTSLKATISFMIINISQFNFIFSWYNCEWFLFFFNHR